MVWAMSRICSPASASASTPRDRCSISSSPAAPWPPRPKSRAGCRWQRDFADVRCRQEGLLRQGLRLAAGRRPGRSAGLPRALLQPHPRRRDHRLRDTRQGASRSTRALVPTCRTCCTSLTAASKSIGRPAKRPNGNALQRSQGEHLPRQAHSAVRRSLRPPQGVHRHHLRRRHQHPVGRHQARSRRHIVTVEFVIETVDVKHLMKLTQNLRKVPGRAQRSQRVQRDLTVAQRNVTTPGTRLGRLRPALWIYESSGQLNRLANRDIVRIHAIGRSDPPGYLFA